MVTLDDHEVHVWELGLDREPEAVVALTRWLDPAEHARAARFKFDRDRRRYIVGRAILRWLLGRYLDRSPATVEFVYGPHEKPLLASGGLWFNLSNSGPLALVAVTRVAEVGIDLELDKVDFEVQRIADRFFSPAEVAALMALPEAERPRAFLTCWTRKEAFIKARGDGLSLPLDSFDVTLGDGSPARLLRTAWSREEPGQWHLRDLSDPRQGYVAALAIRSGAAQLIRQRVDDSFDFDRDTH